VHGSFPLGAASRGTAAVGDDHGESLIGEPLRGEEGVVRAGDAQRVRSAVGVEQDRQRRPVEWVVVGEEHRVASSRVADASQVHVRLHQRDLGERIEFALTTRRPDRRSGTGPIERRRPHHRRVAADRCAVHPRTGLHGLDAFVVAADPPPHLELRGVVGRVGEKRHDGLVCRCHRRRDRPHLQVCGTHATPSTSRRRRPSRSAAVTRRPSVSRVGVPGTSSTQASSYRRTTPWSPRVSKAADVSTSSTSVRR
jgi:hypothetical protein